MLTPDTRFFIPMRIQNLDFPGISRLTNGDSHDSRTAKT